MSQARQKSFSIMGSEIKNTRSKKKETTTPKSEDGSTEEFVDPNPERRATLPNSKKMSIARIEKYYEKLTHEDDNRDVVKKIFEGDIWMNEKTTEEFETFLMSKPEKRKANDKIEGSRPDAVTASQFWLENNKDAKKTDLAIALYDPVLLIPNFAKRIFDSEIADARILKAERPTVAQKGTMYFESHLKSIDKRELVNYYYLTKSDKRHVTNFKDNDGKFLVKEMTLDDVLKSAIEEVPEEEDPIIDQVALKMQKITILPTKWFYSHLPEAQDQAADPQQKKKEEWRKKMLEAKEEKKRQKLEEQLLSQHNLRKKKAVKRKAPSSKKNSKKPKTSKK